MGELRERRRLALPLLAGDRRDGRCRSLIYLAFNAGHAVRARLGRGDVDRHRVRARHARARRAAVPRPAARVHAHGRRRRRPRRAARDRDRLHASTSRSAPLLVAVGALRGRARRPCALGVRRGLVYAALGAAIWVALFKSGVDPVVVGLAMGLLDLRLPGRARRPRAGERAVPALPRAADAGARALGARRASRRRSRRTSGCSSSTTRGRAT